MRGVGDAGRGTIIGRRRRELKHVRRVTFDGRRWSNAASDRVELSEPDARWPKRFAVEAKRIRAVLDDDLNPRIEHVGSTAIPGIAAKPILDIVLILPAEAGWDRLVAPLESLDYVYWAENPRSDRMFFVKGMPPYGTRRTHHVHVRRPDDAVDMLLFRDHLSQRSDVAARYEALKRRLVRHHPTDREAYTRAKDRFIAAVLADAKGSAP